jgi:hypothetical protein
MLLCSGKFETGRSLHAGHVEISAGREPRYIGETFTPKPKGPFAALDLASRRSIAIPKSAQLLLTGCSNGLVRIEQNRTGLQRAWRSMGKMEGDEPT